MADNEEPTWDKTLDDVESAISEDEYEVQDLVEWLSTHSTTAFAASLVEQYDTRGFLSPKQIVAAKKMRAQADDPVTDPGMYRLPDGSMRKVQRAKAGHLYALVFDPETDEWDYEKGGMSSLLGSMKVSGL